MCVCVTQPLPQQRTRAPGEVGGVRTSKHLLLCLWYLPAKNLAKEEKGRKGTRMPEPRHPLLHRGPQRSEKKGGKPGVRGQD